MPFCERRLRADRRRGGQHPVGRFSDFRQRRSVYGPDQYVPFGGANAGLTLGQTLILLNNRGSRTDVMKFNITLSPLPNLPAGDYTGTLTIQAQAI